MKRNLITLAGMLSLLLLGSMLMRSLVEPVIPIHTDPVPVQYIGKVKLASTSVRLLCLRHAPEQMASDDAQMVLQAANFAAGQGLSIQDIGNYLINRNNLQWGECYDIPRLKEFISRQMKINASPGDTLIIFTVGHGGTGGQLATLGNRREVVKAFADAAEENNQETIWYQLSCYASADLPSINSLNPRQQELFSIIASSDSNTPSPAYVEGKLMQKIFVAIGNESMDTNRDGCITAGEMTQFIQTTGYRRYVYARSNDEQLFGMPWALRIPIIGQDGREQEHPRDFIPLPRR